MLLTPSTVSLSSTDENSIGKHDVSLNISLVDYWQATPYIATFEAEVLQCVVTKLTPASPLADIAFVIGESIPVTISLPEWNKDIDCEGVEVEVSFRMSGSIVGVEY